MALGMTTTSLEGQEQKYPLLFVDTDKVTIQGRVDASVGSGPGYRGSWFNLVALRDRAFNPSRDTAEGWFAPGIDITLRPAKSVEVYGGLSVGLSGTWGTDLYDQSNQGAALLENAFAGIRTTNPKTSWNVDLSVGQQNYGVGTGMLIWDGADNGFERGADFLAPRMAWANTAIVRLSYNGFGVEGFYLDPNELRSSDTGTKLAGGVVQYRWSEKSLIGLSYIRVLESTEAYRVFRFPFLIPNGRDGLEAVQGFAIIDGQPVGLPNAWVRGEFAFERNPRIDMKADAFYAEIGYRFATLPLAPTLSYGYATFSGDDPSTPQFERFDPLYYGNGQNNWSFGSNSSYAFSNSNVNFNRITLGLTASERDALRLQYIHTRANVFQSGIQLGNELAARLGVLDGALNVPIGLRDPHLADEIYGDWTHTFDPTVSRDALGIRRISRGRPEIDTVCANRDVGRHRRVTLGVDSAANSTATRPELSWRSRRPRCYAAAGCGGSLPAGVVRSGSSSIRMSATSEIARNSQADANTQRNTCAASVPLALIVDVTTDTAAPCCGVTPRPASRIKNFGAHEECSRDSHSLLHSTRKLIGQVALEALQSYSSDQFAR